MIRPLDLSALVAIQIGFALNYIFSKLVMKSLPPLVWGNIRTLLTALFLVLVLSLKGRLRLDLAWKDKKPLLLFSLLGVVINQATFLMGLQLTTTANSSLINTTIPIFTVLWVILSGQERFSLRNGLGFVLALMGVWSLQSGNQFNFKSDTSRGDALTLLNALSYSFFLFLSPSYFKQKDPVWTTTWIFVLGSVFLFLLSLPDWKLFQWDWLSPPLTLAILGGVLIGTVIPYLLISAVLRTLPSSLVAQFVYLQTLFAVTFGILFLHEKLHSNTFVAALLIFIGLYLSLLGRKGKTR